MPVCTRAYTLLPVAPVYILDQLRRHVLVPRLSLPYILGPVYTRLIIYLLYVYSTSIDVE